MSKKTITDENGKKYTVKEKKPFYKKWWFWLIVAIILIGIIGSNGSSDDSSKKSDTPKTEKKATAKTNNQNKQPKKEQNTTNNNTKNDIGQAVTLSAGQYKVGSQIKPGRYVIKAVNGSGNLSSGNGDINIVLGQQADNTAGQVDSYTADLTNGMQIKIEGINQTSFTPVTNRQFLTQLTAGQWVVGKDIKPGRYKITATAGSGNFTSSDGDINEILGTSSDNSDGQVTSINENLHKGEVINSDLEGVKLQAE